MRTHYLNSRTLKVIKLSGVANRNANITHLRSSTTDLFYDKAAIFKVDKITIKINTLLLI